MLFCATSFANEEHLLSRFLGDYHFSCIINFRLPERHVWLYCPGSARVGR
jgi:hypothetical protein